jgi:3-hydroxyanthranilate 3,4-dioxygenase
MRLPEELDGFMWFCDNCNNKLYEEQIYVSDIVAQLPPIFDRFFSSEDNRTCNECGTVMAKPD